MARRPRGICPVCRNTMSLTWAGDVRVLRRHAVATESCPGSGRPAVGEVTEIPLARPTRAERDPAGEAAVDRSSAA